MIATDVRAYGSGKDSNQDTFHFYGMEDVLNSIRMQVLYLDISFKLTVEVSQRQKKEIYEIYIKGWFTGESGGKWTVTRHMPTQQEYELPMYDWYGMKQRISELVNGVLEDFVGRRQP